MRGGVTPLSVKASGKWQVASSGGERRTDLIIGEYKEGFSIIVI